MRTVEKITGSKGSLEHYVSVVRMCRHESLDEFAKTLGVTVDTLTKIERGERKISSREAEGFAVALGEPVTYFVALSLFNVK